MKKLLTITITIILILENGIHVPFGTGQAVPVFASVIAGLEEAKQSQNSRDCFASSFSKTSLAMTESALRPMASQGSEFAAIDIDYDEIDKIIAGAVSDKRTIFKTKVIRESVVYLLEEFAEYKKTRMRKRQRPGKTDVRERRSITPTSIVRRRIHALLNGTLDEEDPDTKIIKGIIQYGCNRILRPDATPWRTGLDPYNIDDLNLILKVTENKLNAKKDAIRDIVLPVLKEYAEQRGKSVSKLLQGYIGCIESVRRGNTKGAMLDISRIMVTGSHKHGGTSRKIIFTGLDCLSSSDVRLIMAMNEKDERQKSAQLQTHAVLTSGNIAEVFEGAA